METAYVNGGYMVCDHRLVDYLPDDPTMILEGRAMEHLISDGQRHSFRHDGWWQLMETYQEMLYLDRMWAEGRAPWKKWK